MGVDTGMKVDTDFYVRNLPFTIRFLSLGFFVFFVTLAFHSLNLLDFGPLYLSLVRWGQHGEGMLGS